MIKLGVNIDHVATLRNARGGVEPSLIEAAMVAESNGADSITVHLREDRRHIKDKDLYLLRDSLKTVMNLELALTDEMLHIALQVKPKYVCIVPEKREEVTTEGGLDLRVNTNQIRRFVTELQAAGILVSLFIDPSVEQVEIASQLGAYAVELHTGCYSHSFYNDKSKAQELSRVISAASLGNSLGIIVNAGHGLNYHNVTDFIAVVPFLNELNIGHSIISRSIFVGLDNAVREIRSLISN